MKHKNRFFLWGFMVLIFLLLLVFRNWFLFTPLSSGDWRYMYPSAARVLPLFPSSWSNEYNDGLGGSTLFLLPLQSYFLLTSHIGSGILGLPWNILERLVWFWPYLIVSFSGGYFLYKQVFKEEKFAFIGIGIFILNTYSLMLVGGGQMGVAMAYAFSPFVVGIYILLLQKKKNLVWSILSGLILSWQMLLDIRISYITVLAITIYYLIVFFTFLRKQSFGNFTQYISDFIFVLLIPACIVFFLHIFWIVPYVLYPRGPLGEGVQAYISTLSVKFFSFADFAHSLSLLQPNWPENIFGKVYFMDPLFIGLPLLAYASLFFTVEKKKMKRIIVFFVLLGFLGNFLGKGSNDPFGVVYIWFFNHIPGFVLFRDSTKWYTLTAISYSILIPFTISSFFEKLGKYQERNTFFKKIYLLKILSGLLLIYFLSLLLPVFTNKLTGTFAKHEVPSGYFHLATFLEQDKHFYRTLWVPADERYGYTSTSKQAVSASDFFATNDLSKILLKLSDKQTLSLLQRWGVRYIMIPDDPQKEIYIRNREYDSKLLQKTQAFFYTQTLFPFVGSFGNIQVYAVPGTKDLMTFSSSDKNIAWRELSPTSYEVNLEKNQGDLVFAMKYDPFWKLENNGQVISAQNYHGVNVFPINNMKGKILIEYLPQRSVLVFFWVSFFALLASFVSLLLSMMLSRKK